jgi:hypothetical protein
MAARRTPAATARAVHAALARPPVPEPDGDSYPLAHDSDEDARQILAIITERTCFALRSSPETQS